MGEDGTGDQYYPGTASTSQTYVPTPKSQLRPVPHQDNITAIWATGPCYSPIWLVIFNRARKPPLAELPAKPASNAEVAKKPPPSLSIPKGPGNERTKGGDYHRAPCQTDKKQESSIGEREGKDSGGEGEEENSAGDGEKRAAQEKQKPPERRAWHTNTDYTPRFLRKNYIWCTLSRLCAYHGTMRRRIKL